MALPSEEIRLQEIQIPYYRYPLSLTFYTELIHMDVVSIFVCTKIDREREQEERGEIDRELFLLVIFQGKI